MHEQGMTGVEIGVAIGVDKNSVYNAIYTMGLKKRYSVEEETLVYAEYRKPILERIEINGKIYTDITQLFAPR